MDGNDDQLLALGQQILDTLTAAYVPAGDNQHALALFPGQAVPDEIVQADQTNPLQLSEWLGALYDFPLDLKAAAGTTIVTTVQSGVTLRSAYSIAARNAVAAVAVGDPSLPRIEALIADARQDVADGSEAQLPFGCVPEGFAETDSTGWQTFDTVISAHADDTTVTVDPTARPDPMLWRLHAIPETLSAELAKRVVFHQQRLAVSAETPALSLDAVRVATRQMVLPPPRDDTPSVAVPNLGQASMEISKVAAAPTFAQSSASLVSSAFTATSFAATPTSLRATEILRKPFGADTYFLSTDTDTNTNQPAGTLYPAYRPEFVTPLVNVDRDDLATAPTTTSMTAADSSLHVHFEHLVVTITHSRAGVDWWHPELLAESQWYVPGMGAGQLVAASSTPDSIRCRPLSLLLVRNLSLTGTWSTSASELMSGVHYVGPFLMQIGGGSTAATSQATSIGGVGVQVIGVIGGPIPPLPPSGDPATDPTAMASTVDGGQPPVATVDNLGLSAPT